MEKAEEAILCNGMVSLMDRPLQSSDLDTAKIVWDPLDKEQANTPTQKKKSFDLKTTGELFLIILLKEMIRRINVVSPNIHF